MADKNRFLIRFSATILVLFLGFVLVASAVRRAGTLSVDYECRHPGGDRISLRVPGVLVEAALHFVPEAAFPCEMERDPARRIGCLRASVEELARLPDAILVDVRDGEERVFIRKWRNALVIDVESPRELVHLVIPLPTIRAVVEKLEPAEREA